MPADALDAIRDWFAPLDPVRQAFIATVGTWMLTLAGAATVLFVRNAPRRLLDGMLGFAGGVMTAAAAWSLLTPALELGGVGPATIGFALGAAFIYALDQVLPHLHPPYAGRAEAEGVDVAWRRTVLLVLAITMHNIPEGLAVGVAYGAGDWVAATTLAVGIALQNVPEGLAVALPLRREGIGRWRALWYGQLSAVVEPVAGVAGAALVVTVGALLPYGLAFAAGAMLYVVVEELIPEAERGGNTDIATIGFMIGFAVMMALDNAVG
ncbi:MAG: ZIP family metal transporter [Gemmatimonadota bacterium]